MDIKFHIKEFMEILNKNVNKLNDLFFRNRKLSAKDLLYFLTLKNGNNSSYDITNAKFKCDKIVDTSKASIIKKRNKICFSEFVNLNNALLNCIYNDSKVRYVAVDGSQLNFIKNLKNQFEINKHKTYCSGLLSSLFDIDKKIPINYSLFKSFDEREALISQFPYLKKNDVLIMDRGYYSDDLLKQIYDQNFDAVFRIKNNSKFVKQLNNNNETVINKVIDGKNIKVKIVHYTINKEEYYICSTLIDKSVAFFKELYWKRWNIETDFRHLKYDLSLASIQSKSINIIKQDVAVHNFIQITVGFLEDLLKCNLMDNYKINKKNSIKLTINNLLYYFLYKKKTKKILNKIMHILNIIKKTISKIVQNRKFKRIRKLPSSKWNIIGNKFIKR